jgi:hypothetical protein
MRFRVEYIGIFQGIAHVIARQIDPGNFVMVILRASVARQFVDGSHNQGKPDGGADLEVFTFALQSASDAGNLAVGQIVQLTNAGNGNEAT